MKDPGGNAAPSGGFQNNGWYSGYNYYNGQWGGAPGDFASGNPNGKGTVSSTVAAQTNPNNVAYLNNARANVGAAPLSGSGATGTMTGANGSSMFGNQPAMPDLKSIYDQNYTNNPNVKTTQSSITDLQNQIAQRSQARDTAESNINDNPFYAEATRTGKVSQLNTDYNNDVNTLNGQLTTQQTNLSNMEAEAQRQVNLSQGQYTMENQQYQENLQEFNTLLSAGGLENADPGTLASLSVSTGIPTSMLQSIQTGEQAKNTQIVSSTDNAGNVTLVAVNSTNGKVINSTSLGAIGAAKTSGGSATTKANDIASTYMNLLTSIANGNDLKSIVSRFAVPGGLTEAQIIQTYNNPGFKTPYGPAKETAKQIKAGQFADQKGFNSGTIQ